jgi:polysaccharide deacetylase family sporulation protein PdaB
MIDAKLRLITMLGIITVVVLAGLMLDYFNVLKRPFRIGLSFAIVGMLAGAFLTLNAVLPQSKLFGQVFCAGPSADKVVALTFDDGPNPPYTDEILGVLGEFHVPATFFVIGQNAKLHPEEVRRIVAAGHEIGNHTYHHVDLLKLDRKTMTAEIDRTNRLIRELTGKTPHLIRPPHGFRDPASLEIMKDRNLKVVEWSVMSRDWTNPGVDAIVKRTVEQVKNGSIILLHDGDGLASKAPRSQTVAALRQIIPLLKDKGYRFVTVDEILQHTEGSKK